jgi:hypothetical protein
MIQVRSNWVLSVLHGSAVSLLIAASVGWGVRFVLHLLDWWQVSTINTIILYGMLFIIAKVGVEYQNRRRKSSGEEKGPADETDVPDRNTGPPGMLSILWSLFATYTVLWLTPALIIFWIYGTDYPPDIIMLFVYLLSLAASLVYFYANGKKWPAMVDKAGYIVGACLGPVIVSQLLRWV